MPPFLENEELVTLHLGGSAAPQADEAANGAPVGEPEVWNPEIVEANPHLGHSPEPEPIAVSPEFAADANFDINAYLAEERGKDLLRFSTAGSVDDGKSTLIGRLLYDTQSVYADQVKSIEGKGTTAPGVLDLALLTDGLRAEREQGITIDVAYRYFSTARRKFIIADTPGHEQYTRNMATGASTADVAIVLIDARKGVLPQSRRHAYITALLGVRHLIVAVNKMDLVGYDEGVFQAIERSFRSFFNGLDVEGTPAQLHFVPVSALAGDNVVHGSDAMPWYMGPSLLALLEDLPAADSDAEAPFRMFVQRVVRPNLDFRGFAGQIEGGTVRVGDRVTVLPSGQSSRVQRIPTFDGDVSEASAPLSITLLLEDEIDISRGDLLTSAAQPANVATAFRASMVWMDTAPLDRSRRYLLKHGSRNVHANVTEVIATIDLTDGAEQRQEATATLGLNSIGVVHVQTLQPLAFDAYAHNRHTGSFVLIDLQTNATVAAGMVRTSAAGEFHPDIPYRQGTVTALPEHGKGTASALPRSVDGNGASAPEVSFSGNAASLISAGERTHRHGHRAAVVHVAGENVALAIERALFDQGCFAVRLHAPSPQTVADLLVSGVLLIVVDQDLQAERFRIDDAEESALPAGTSQAVDAILQRLRERGVFPRGGAA